MKKLFKKGISSVLALSMAASMSFVIPFTANAADAAEPTSGTIGTNCKWELDTASGTLTFSAADASVDNGNYTIGTTASFNVAGDFTDDEKSKMQNLEMPVDKLFAGKGGPLTITIPATESAAETYTLNHTVLDGTKKIVLTEGCTLVGAAGLAGFAFAEEIVFPQSTLTEIQKWAFQRDYSLKELTIPDSVVKMEQQTFSYCRSLESFIQTNENATIGVEGKAPIDVTECKNLTTLMVRGKCIGQSGAGHSLMGTDTNQNLKTLDLGTNSLNAYNVPSSVETVVCGGLSNDMMAEGALPDTVKTLAMPEGATVPDKIKSSENTTLISTPANSAASVDPETGKLTVPSNSTFTQTVEGEQKSAKIANEIEIADPATDTVTVNDNGSATLPAGTTVKDTTTQKTVELKDSVTVPNDATNGVNIPVSSEGTATLPAGTTITQENGTKITPPATATATINSTGTTTLPEGTKIEKTDKAGTTTTVETKGTSTMDSTGTTTLGAGSTIEKSVEKDGQKEVISTTTAAQGSTVASSGAMELAGNSTITTKNEDGTVTKTTTPANETTSVNAYGETTLPANTTVATYADENAETPTKTETLTEPEKTTIGGDLPELDPTDTTTPIKVSKDGGADADAANRPDMVKPGNGQTVEVAEDVKVDFNEITDEAIKTNITNALTEAGITGDDVVEAVYDLDFSNENLHTNDTVTVKLPVSEGVDDKAYDIYHIVNGTAQKMYAKVEDGYWVFETSSFSPFAEVANNITNTIYVGFEKNSEYAANTNVVYDLYAKAHDIDQAALEADTTGATYKEVINRLMSANFTFDNESDANGIAYEFTPAENLIIDYSTSGGNRYAISYDGSPADSNVAGKGDKAVKLGSIKFVGMGKVDFSIDKAVTDPANVVYTATDVDNIVVGYTVDGEGTDSAPALKFDTDLTVKDNSNAADADKFFGRIKDEIVPVTRDVEVNIAFNNNISGTNNAKDYNDMSVTLKGGNGYDLTFDLGSDVTAVTPDENTNGETAGVVAMTKKNGETTEYYNNLGVKVDAVKDAAFAYMPTDGFTAETAKVVFHDVPAGYNYTVTVAGKGYRTAKYNTMIPADKTDKYQLHFWNNVKDDVNAAPVDNNGNAELAARSTMTKNFLAGDIDDNKFINIYDLSDVVSYFAAGETTRLYDASTDAAIKDQYVSYDLNRDGKIDSQDVAYVLVSWGN